MATAILDSCCVINLYASGHAETIVAAYDGELYVSDAVRSESLSIRQPDPADPTVMATVPIDLSSGIGAGWLRECRPAGAAEMAALARFAAHLDDGEASCLAIAEARSWVVATDDRKATRIATESGIHVIATPDLIQRWIAVARPSEIAIQDVVASIERFARFRPPRSSAHFGWWVGLLPPPP